MTAQAPLFRFLFLAVQKASPARLRSEEAQNGLYGRLSPKDQHGYPGIVPQELFQPRRIVSIRQIGGHDFDLALCFVGKSLSQLVHTLCIPGDEEQVIAAARQAIRINRAYPGGGASDDIARH